MTPLHVLLAFNGTKNRAFTPITPLSTTQHPLKLDFSNQYGCVDYLISRGAQVNAQDYYGLTALHYASIKDNFEGADYLIKKTKPNINIHVLDFLHIISRNVALRHKIL